MNKISRNIWIFKTKLMGMREVGRRSCIYKPLQIDNPCSISVGSKVFVGHYSWLIGSEKKGGKGLIIGDNTTIGHFSHIVANYEVVIEKDVLLADKVFISDCNHNYREINIPIKDQGVLFIKPVRIGTGSWLGENVCVCGASVGKHCVIAANSVVTKDIQDYCVAAGIPARVVKKYNFETKLWEKFE